MLHHAHKTLPRAVHVDARVLQQCGTACAEVCTSANSRMATPALPDTTDAGSPSGVLISQLVCNWHQPASTRLHNQYQPAHLQALLVDECDGQPGLDGTAHAPQLREREGRQMEGRCVSMLCASSGMGRRAACVLGGPAVKQLQAVAAPAPPHPPAHSRAVW